MENSRYELVIIGGSAGAIDSVKKLLAILPEDYPIPVVIVLHRMRNVSSRIEQIFKRKSNVKLIKEADDKDTLKPGVVYIAPPNYHLLFEEDKTIALDDSELVNFSRPSIDVSFESAAGVYKTKLVSILLSGANDDGSHGMNVIKQYGGLCIAQNPDEAEYNIMPLSAINKGIINEILTLKEIQQRLLSL